MASTASVFGRTVDEASSAPACLRGSTKPHRSRRKGFQLGQTRKHSSTRAHVHATQSMQVRANASTHGVVTSTTCLYRALRKPELGFCAGLVEVGDQVGKLRAGVLDRRLVQVVLARTSDLLGRRVRDTRFRSRFDAAIIALHREGHRLHQPIGETTLAVRPSAAPPNHSASLLPLQCHPTIPHCRATSWHVNAAYQILSTISALQFRCTAELSRRCPDLMYWTQCMLCHASSFLQSRVIPPAFQLLSPAHVQYMQTPQSRTAVSAPVHFHSRLHPLHRTG